MNLVILFIVVHILLWGALGASFAARTGLAPWLCAVVSIVFPVLGVLVLGALAVRRRGASGGRGPTAVASGLGAVGVAGATLILASGWFLWIGGEASGSAPEVGRMDLASWESTGLGLPLLSTLAGAAILVLIVVSWRFGRRAPIPPAAALASVSVILGGIVIAVHRGVDPWVEGINGIGFALAFIEEADIWLSADLSIGQGPRLASGGGLLVLVWAFVWSIFAPRRSLGESPVVAQQVDPVRARAQSASTPTGWDSIGDWTGAGGTKWGGADWAGGEWGGLGDPPDDDQERGSGFGLDARRNDGWGAS